MKHLFFIALFSIPSFADLTSYPSVQGQLLGLRAGLYTSAGNLDFNVGSYSIYDTASNKLKDAARLVGCSSTKDTLSVSFKATVAKSYLENETALGMKGAKLYYPQLDYYGAEMYRIKDVVAEKEPADARIFLETQSGKPAGFDVVVKLACRDANYHAKKIALSYVPKEELPYFFHTLIEPGLAYKPDHTLVADEEPATFRYALSFREPVVFHFKEKTKLSVIKKGDSQELCQFKGDPSIASNGRIQLTYMGASSTEPIYTDPQEIDTLKTVFPSQSLYGEKFPMNSYTNARLEIGSNFKLDISYERKIDTLPKGGSGFVDAIEKGIRHGLQECGWFQVQ